MEKASALTQRYVVKGVSDLRIIRVGLPGEIRARARGRAGLSILAALRVRAAVRKVGGHGGALLWHSWCNIDQVLSDVPTSNV